MHILQWIMLQLQRNKLQHVWYIKTSSSQVMVKNFGEGNCTTNLNISLIQLYINELQMLRCNPVLWGTSMYFILLEHTILQQYILLHVWQKRNTHFMDKVACLEFTCFSLTYMQINIFISNKIIKHHIWTLLWVSWHTGVRKLKWCRWNC